MEGMFPVEVGAREFPAQSVRRLFQELGIEGIRRKRERERERERGIYI